MRGCFQFLVGACAFAAFAAGASVDESLARAEDVKRTSMTEFNRELSLIMADESRLTDRQRDHLAYLLAWRDSFSGDFVSAINEFERLIADAEDPVIRFRSRVTMLNALTVARRYVEAYEQLNELIGDVEHVSDPAARDQALGVIAQLLNHSAQYQQSLQYSQRLIREGAQPWARCGAQMLILEARVRAGELNDVDPEYSQWAERCSNQGEEVFSGLMRTQLARLHLSNGRPEAALSLLATRAESMAATRYPYLLIDIAAIKARAFLMQGKFEAAIDEAQRAIDAASPELSTESRSLAWRVRYEAEKSLGRTDAALFAHEQLLSAEMSYADDVGRRSLAYQMARFEANAKSLEIESLNRQNEVLVLQQQVSTKNAQTAWLAVALLTSLLAFGLHWSIRAMRVRRHFQLLSQRDSLTKVSNRRHFVEQVTKKLEEAKRRGTFASLILIDLDFFKLINDRYGHAEGDDVLQRAAAELCAHVAEGELIGRIGGEEFAILLPGVSKSDAAKRAELCRLSVRKVPYGTNDAQRPLTASFGIASTDQSGYELRELMIKADAALYMAKDAGRDRVSVYHEEQQQSLLPV